MSTVCERCKVEFKYRCHLERHMNRKTKCKEKVPEEREEEYRCKYCMKKQVNERVKRRHEEKCRFREDEIRMLEIREGIEIEAMYETNKCRFCEKKYSTNKKMIQHMKTCKKREEYRLKIVNAKLKTEMKNARQNNTQNAQVINNNCNINNNIMIQMVPFGKENFNYIEKDLKGIMKCLRYNAENAVDEVKNLVIKLVKKMHGHKDHPENHNILMDGKNKPHATVFTENGFERRCAIDVSQELVEQAGNFVCDEYDFGDELTKEAITEQLYKNTDLMTVSADRGSKTSRKLRAAVKEMLCDQQTRQMVKSTIEKCTPTITMVEMIEQPE